MSTQQALHYGKSQGFFLFVFFFLKATLVPSIYSAHGTICLMKLDLPHDGENPAWHVS